MNYAFFRDGWVGGGFDPQAKPSSRKGINLVIKVRNIPSVIRKIRSSGGTLLKARRPIGGGYGFIAYIKDPNGNLLSV